jgi:lipopolysaccharide/colanic/teichoic acid biosynthesis glycosyltransferase
MKRVMDLGLAVCTLLLLWPVFLLVAIAIRISMGRPVLFRQMRPGMGEKPFAMWKFRTMTDLCDLQGNPLPDGRRITALGKFLRKTSLDELPELWNVLRGEMSLVGPRPLLMKYLPYYTPRERKRSLVRPGISGWAQVNGRNLVGWDERFALDVWYVENWSLWLDVKILFLTILTTLRASTVVVDAETLGKNLDDARSGGKGSCP